jgi:hypothetical protein
MEGLDERSSMGSAAWRMYGGTRPEVIRMMFQLDDDWRMTGGRME